MKNLYAIKTLCIALFCLISLSALSQTQVTVTNTTSPAVCDGSATLDSMNVLLTSIYWMGGGVVLQQGGYTINNLCPGTYTVSFNINGTQVTLTFIVGSATNPCNSLMLTLSGTQASTPTAMDGAIAATAVGGTSPYAFTWSNGVSSSSLTNLGVGWYTCCVTDANGCYTCDSFNVISSINPGNDTVLIINNNNIPNVLDSLGTQQIIDCALDYNAIGAAYIVSSSYTPGGNPLFLDTIYLTWQVLDTLVPANVLATYTIGYPVYPPLAGSYVAGIQIYCPQKNTNYNTLLAFDQFYSAQLGLIENDFTPGIFVNDGLATLQMGTSQHGKIRVYSSNGNVVLENGIQNATEVKFNVSKWNSGIYFVHYSFETGRNGVVKFVKP